MVSLKNHFYAPAADHFFKVRYGRMAKVASHLSLTLPATVDGELPLYRRLYGQLR